MTNYASINMNSNVTFHLTKKGADLLNRQQEEKEAAHPELYKNRCIPGFCEGQEVTTPLWDFTERMLIHIQRNDVGSFYFTNLRIELQ